jgi:hypothetical protein
MATRLRTGRSGVRIPVGAIDLSLRNVQTGCGAHPAFLFSEYRGSFQGLSQLGCEVNYSPPSSAEVQNEWSYTSPSPYAFMAWALTPYLQSVQRKYILPEPVTCFHSYCWSTVTWHQIQRVPQARCRLRPHIIVCYAAVLTALFLLCLCMTMNMSRSVRVRRRVIRKR